jgi:hypothetical protein
MSDDGWVLSDGNGDRVEKRLDRVIMFVEQVGEDRFLPYVKLWQNDGPDDVIQATIRRAHDLKSLAKAKNYAVGLAVKVVNLCSRGTA